MVGDNGNLLKDEGGTLWKVLNEGQFSHNVIHKMLGRVGTSRFLLSLSIFFTPPVEWKDYPLVSAE